MMTDSPAPASDETVAIQNSEDLAAARLRLLQAGRYRLWIYVPALSADSFSSPAELDEIRRIATAGRGSEIHILLRDAATALRHGHRLIDLAQRLPSMLRIRMPADEEDVSTSSMWLLNDTSGYVFLPEADRPIGRSASTDRRGYAPLLLQFEQIWQRATPASLLQPLDM